MFDVMKEWEDFLGNVPQKRRDFFGSGNAEEALISDWEGQRFIEFPREDVDKITCHNYVTTIAHRCRPTRCLIQVLSELNVAS